MLDEEIFQKGKKWAESGLMTMRMLLPLMKPVSAYVDWKPDEQPTLIYLLSATARATESAILLCAYGQLWEAEVLARSVLEGTMKFCYLLQSRERFPARFREYTIDQFHIGRTKDHLKASELLASVPNPEAPEWLPIKNTLLSEEELSEIRARHSKSQRARLETRWGFTGLIGELSRSEDSMFRGFGANAYGYSIASHIYHMDMAGASIPLERDMRSQERRDTIHFAHEGRLISNLLTYFYWRLSVGYRFVGADDEPVRDAWSVITAVTAEFKDANDKWLDVEYRSGDDADEQPETTAR